MKFKLIKKPFEETYYLGRKLKYKGDIFYIGKIELDKNGPSIHFLNEDDKLEDYNFGSSVGWSIPDVEKHLGMKEWEWVD